MLLGGWLLIAASAGIFYVILACFGLPNPDRELRFPAAFVFSSILFISTSAMLGWAQRCVRFERRERTRWVLPLALFSSAVFLGVQGYGYWCVFSDYSLESGVRGPLALVLSLGTAHTMACIVVLALISSLGVHCILRRDDTELRWLFKVSVWSWQALGVAWTWLAVVFALTL